MGEVFLFSILSRRKEVRFNEQSISQYSGLNQSGKIFSQEDVKGKIFTKSKDWMIFLLYASILALLFSSFFYSGQILKKIEEKKDVIVKLKKTYNTIAIENEKIKVLISELKSNKPGSRKMIKVLGDFYFREKAAKLQKDYYQNQIAKEPSGMNYYYVLIGIFLIAIIRFTYLEISEKRAVKKIIGKRTINEMNKNNLQSKKIKKTTNLQRLI